MPNPVARVKPGAAIQIGNSGENPAQRHPEIALLALSVIAEWSTLQVFLNWVFIKMLGADPVPGAEIYSALKGTSAQHAALQAIARIALQPDELPIFEAILSLFRTAAKDRNKIAHWTWGYALEIPDAVLLCDSKVVMQHHVKMQHLQNMKQHPRRDMRLAKIEDLYTKDMLRSLRKETLVWSAADFAKSLEKIRHVTKLTRLFVVLLTRDGPAQRDGRVLAQLLADHEVHRRINRPRST